jgi:dTDP-4-dehydrorhamnose reductase
LNFFCKAKRGILFVYISTDYVFDGQHAPYKIDAERNPLNRYGLSKMNGEIATLNASKGKMKKRGKHAKS